jgi:hypothetical protein
VDGKPFPATHITRIKRIYDAPVEFTRGICPPDCDACARLAREPKGLREQWAWERKKGLVSLATLLGEGRRDTTKTDPNVFEDTGPMILELDLRQGRLVRFRHGLEEDIGALHLVGGTVRRFARVFDGAPLWTTFYMQRIRARFRKERMHRDWSFGTWTRAAGLPIARAGKIAELERGQRVLEVSAVDALARALDISSDDLQAIREAEKEDYAAACEAWQSTLVDDVLTWGFDGYYAPVEFRGDAEASIAWASRFVKAAWRRYMLLHRRREVIAFTHEGEILGRAPLVPPTFGTHPPAWTLPDFPT